MTTNYERADEIVATLPDLTEEEAVWVIARIMNDHQITGALFGPNDIRDHLENSVLVGDVERPVTDADVEAVLRTWEWRKGICEVLCERGYELLADACDEVLDADGDLRVAE
jgi:hypothetical protein